MKFDPELRRRQCLQIPQEQRMLYCDPFGAANEKMPEPVKPYEENQRNGEDKRALLPEIIGSFNRLKLWGKYYYNTPYAAPGFLYRNVLAFERSNPQMYQKFEEFLLSPVGQISLGGEYEVKIGDIVLRFVSQYELESFKDPDFFQNLEKLATLSKEEKLLFLNLSYYSGAGYSLNDMLRAFFLLIDTLARAGKRYSDSRKTSVEFDTIKIFLECFTRVPPEAQDIQLGFLLNMPTNFTRVRTWLDRGYQFVCREMETSLEGYDAPTLEQLKNKIFSSSLLFRPLFLRYVALYVEPKYIPELIQR